MATCSSKAASLAEVAGRALGAVSLPMTFWQVFLDLDFTLMEMNPFTLDSKGMPFPLDMRGELDDTAAFKSGKKWGDFEFPLPFGRIMTSAEEHIHTLDSNTGMHPPRSCKYLCLAVLCDLAQCLSTVSRPFNCQHINDNRDAA